jgi:hypothetical protein
VLRFHGLNRPSAESNTTLQPALRNRRVRPLANCSPVPQAIACSLFLARQITFRNKIPPAGVQRFPVSINESFIQALLSGKGCVSLGTTTRVDGLNGHSAHFVIDLSLGRYEHTILKSRSFTALFAWTPGPEFLKPGLKSTQKSRLTLSTDPGLRINWDKFGSVQGTDILTPHAPLLF